MEVFIHDEEQEDFTLSDREITTFILQPGFVEPYRGVRKEFEKIEDAYADILSETREQLMLLWNGIPFPIDYPRTLSAHFPKLIAFLEKITAPLDEPARLDIESALGRLTLVAVERENERLLLKIESTADAPLLDVIARLNILLIERKTFLAEWKLLLQQMLEAFIRSEVQVRDISLIQRLYALNQQIPNFGMLYAHLNAQE